MKTVIDKTYLSPDSLQTKEKYSRWAEWLIPTTLILLSLIPVIGGSVRMTQLASGAGITPENARFFASPIPVTLHIISVSLYAVLGAFQFAPRFRRRHFRWHRLVGRLLVPCGFIAALTGLWMSHFYPWPLYDGYLLYGLRLFFGTGIFLSLILAVWAIWQRNFTQHGAWMVRAYAIGMGAGTQVLTHIPWAVFPAIQSELTRAIFMGAGWVINLLIAEWFIRYSLLGNTRVVSTK